MPFGHWKDFQACLDDIGKKNPDYSAEQVRRTCGKLQAKLEKCTDVEKAYAAIKSHLDKSKAPDPPDIKVDVDPQKGQMQIKKSWPHELQDILNSPRIAEMTFHVPKVDKDMEFITAGAMAEALQDYMKFPIISEFHKERPIGIAESVWQTVDDEFKARIRIRDDPSTDDVWQKINSPKGTPGRYDQVSIAGKRLMYSPECDLPLPMRKATRPCRTEKLRLDSVSVCDDRARNDGTELTVVKALSDDQTAFVYTTTLDITKVKDNLIKAENTENELIHPVTDGANQPDKTRIEDNIVCPLIHPGTTKKSSRGGKMEEKEAQGSVEEAEAKKCSKTEPRVEKMKKGTEKKPSEEEEKESVEEETEETKKAPEMEEKEEAKKAEDPYQEILKLLRELVASDKKVHKEVEKSEEKKEEKMEEKKVEKAETPPPVPAVEDVKKAAMEQDFQKALDAAIAPLQQQIIAIAAEVKALGDQPMFKSALRIQDLVVDKKGNVELGTAGALAEQKKRTRGGK